MVVSYTNREPRNSDLPGEYSYISQTQFEKMDSDGEFIWTAGPYGNNYGTTKKSVDEALSDDETTHIMLLVGISIEILLSYAQDMARGRSIKSFYILSPSPEVLRERLKKRGDEPKKIEQRLAESLGWDSSAKSSKIPYVFVVNDGKIEDAVNEIIIFLKCGDCCF